MVTFTQECYPIRARPEKVWKRFGINFRTKVETFYTDDSL